MNSEKLVTVYMPTHNRPRLAIRAIRSVLNQTYKNIELIVCDDASDKGDYGEVKNILQEAGGKYIRLDIGSGACAARNAAIRSAQGEFITGIDDDDEFLPNHIEKLMQNYDPEYAFVCAGYVRVHKKIHSRQRYPWGILTLDRVLHSNCVGNQVLTETWKLLDVDMFDEKMPAMQDYDTWIRLLLNFGDAFKLKECTYLQHLNDGQVRISSNSEKLKTALTQLQYKYESLYSQEHKKSLKLLAIRNNGEQLTLSTFFTLINTSNIRFAISLYVRQVFSKISKFPNKHV